MTALSHLVMAISTAITGIAQVTDGETLRVEGAWVRL